MKFLSVCFLVLLVLGAVQRSDAQTCNTTLSSALSSRDELSILNTVVASAGLASFLNDSSLNVTVFAPNNNAMLAFQQDLTDAGLTLANVTNSSNNVAASIIRYHVVTTPATAAQLVNRQVLPTLLSGYNLTVQRNATTVDIEGVESDATVVTPDIPVCGSYVHIIDDVLLPAKLNQIQPYEPPAPSPGTPPTPPGTVTPPPPPPPSAATKVGSSMLMGVAVAIVAVFAPL